MKKSIALIIIIFLIISISGCINENKEDQNKENKKNFKDSNLIRVSIGFFLYPQAEKLSLEELGINETIFSKFDNETLMLKITLLNNKSSMEYYYQGEYYNFHIINNDTLQINDPKINYRYNLSLHYIIKSPYSDVRNLSIMGLNNYLNLSFIVTEDWKINITLDPEFSSFEYMISYDSEIGKIFIDRFQNNEKDILISAHVCVIMPLIIHYVK